MSFTSIFALKSGVWLSKYAKVVSKNAKIDSYFAEILANWKKIVNFAPDY